MKKYFIILIVLFLLPGVFCVKAQTSGTDTVNVSALVPEWPGGGFIPPDNIFPAISDIAITEITLNSVNISWATSELAVPQINYGEISDYTKTFIGDSFSVSNSIFLENLSAGAIYHFEIIAIDRAGNRTSSGDLIFETLFLFDIVSPANVNLFTAEAIENKIILNWENPQDSDFSGIQINRKINSPALNFDQGEIIYSGNQENFEDENIENGIKYYYTAFSYDSAKNFSSGAIASAIGIKTATPPVEPPVLPDPPTIPPEIIPFDVENLETIPDLENKEIEIKWDIPEVEEFEEIEIYKSADFPALVPGEGEIIYKGKENNFKDKNINEDAVYYYTVFIKNKSGNYSAGKTVTGTIKKLPVSPIEDINIKDINFIFSKEALLLPQREDRKIYTFPNKEINIYYDSKNLPETLKTIMVTVGRSSYILGSDNDNKFYRTKFISPDNAGDYPIIISVLDFKHGKIFQTKTELIIEDYGKTYEFKDGDYESKNFFEKKILDIRYWILDTFCGKDTKCPIGHLVSALALDLEKAGVEEAIITLYKFNKENNDWQIWDAKKYNQENPQITNENGNFGFIVPNGKYKIIAEKDNYVLKNEIIEVENNIINSEIEIKGKTDWRWLILIIIILFSVLIIRRKLKRKKNKTRQDTLDTKCPIGHLVSKE